MSKILMVEDDSALCLMVQNWLQLENHVLEVVNDGNEGLFRLRSYLYDLAIVDWELPGISGIEICKHLRQEGRGIPLLMLTGKKELGNTVEGFNSGADDHLTKPFALEELSVRVRALLRRPPTFQNTILVAGDLQLDPVKGTVNKGTRVLHLPRKEFALLEFFMRHPNQVFAPEALLDRVWSCESDSSPEFLRPYIARLRAKIDTKGTAGSLIETVHGTGYKFVPSSNLTPDEAQS